MRGMAIVRNLALHFFSYFVGGSMPKLTVAFDDRSPVELTEYVNRHVRNPVTETLAVPAVDGCVLEILHLYVARSISRDLRNSILIVAHDRQVEGIEIERKFALDDLPDGTAYIAVVRGPFLDERVGQERTGFKLTPEQREAIVGAVMERCENFLLSHIGKRRSAQKAAVMALLSEHPQLAAKVGDIDTYVAGLGASMDEEDIAKTLFTLLYRDERRIAKDVGLLNGAGDVSQEVSAKAVDTLAKAMEQAKARLTEYAVKRRQILDLGKTLMRFGPGDPSRCEYERIVRDLKDAEQQIGDVPP